MFHTTNSLKYLFNIIFPCVLSILLVNYSENKFQIIGFGLLFLTVSSVFNSINIEVKIKNLVTSIILAIAVFSGCVSLILNINSGQEDLFAFLSAVTTFVSLIFLLTTISTHVFDSNRIIRFISVFFEVYILAQIGGIFKFYSNLKESTNQISGKFSVEFILKKVATLVFILPIILIITGLLAYTNSDFAYFLSGIADLISFGNAFEYILAFLVSSFVITGVYRYVDDLKTEKIERVYRINSIIGEMWARFVVYTLAALNFVYIVYCYFEITCNSKGLRECVVGIKENSSYSEGAIQAFLALVVVMGINFVLNYLIATRIIGKFRRLSFEAIMMVLSFIMTIVLIFSSASRLWLYIEGYGVTNARIFLALFYLFTLAACLIAIWGIYLKKERVINWILAIYFLLIATFFALPSSDLVVFSNYYLAKNGIVKVYDPIAPYYIDQIDEIRNNKVIKTICKDDFYQEVLKKLEKSEYEKYLEDAKYSGYSYGYEPQRLYLNYSKICD